MHLHFRCTLSTMFNSYIDITKKARIEEISRNGPQRRNSGSDLQEPYQSEVNELYSLRTTLQNLTANFLPLKVSLLNAMLMLSLALRNFLKFIQRFSMANDHLSNSARLLAENLRRTEVASEAQ